jgi:hypothetical protein
MTCWTENINGFKRAVCNDPAETWTAGRCWYEEFGGRNVQVCPSNKTAEEAMWRDAELRTTNQMNREADAVGSGFFKLIGLRFAESLVWAKTKDVEEYVASCREPPATLQIARADLDQIKELIPLLEQYIAAGRVGIMTGAVDSGYMVSADQVAYGLRQARLALNGLKAIQTTARMVDLSQLSISTQKEFMGYVPDLTTVLDGLKFHLKKNILHDMGRCFGTSISEASLEFSHNVTFNILTRYPAAGSAVTNVINGPAVSAVKNAGSGLGPWGKVAIGAGIAALAAGAAAYFWLTSE